MVNGEGNVDDERQVPSKVGMAKIKNEVNDLGNDHGKCSAVPLAPEHKPEWKCDN